jgi:hypothetical protein
MRTKEEIIAMAIVDCAGRSGGIDEVRRIAERGWPGASEELRKVIQARAIEVVRQVDEEAETEREPRGVGSGA